MSGWAWHKGDEVPKNHGPFSSDIPPPGGVYLTDMPLGRPLPRPEPKIKGVPRATPQPDDEDYQPGSGTWFSL